MLFSNKLSKAACCSSLLLSLVFTSSGYAAAPGITGYERLKVGDNGMHAVPVEPIKPEVIYSCPNNYMPKKKGSKYVCTFPGSPDIKPKIILICPEGYKLEVASNSCKKTTSILGRGVAKP